MSKAKNHGSTPAPRGNKKGSPAPELSDRLASFEFWLVRNWRVLFAVAAVVIALVIVYYIVVQVGEARENAAATAVAQATDSTALAAVVKEHANTQAVNPARMQLAVEASKEKRYAEALEYMHMVVGSSADYALTAEALMLAAATHENAGDDNAAADNFKKVAADVKQPLARRTEAAYQAGRILLKAGQTDAARAMLQQAADANAGSKPMEVDYTAEVYARQAKALLNKINGQ